MYEGTNKQRTNEQADETIGLVILIEGWLMRGFFLKDSNLGSLPYPFWVCFPLAEDLTDNQSQNLGVAAVVDPTVEFDFQFAVCILIWRIDNGIIRMDAWNFNC